MANILKALGIFLMIFAMLLTMGAGVIAETEGVPPQGEDPANLEVSIEVESDKASYLLGEAIEYSIKIANAGNFALADLILFDELLGKKVIGNLDVGEVIIFDESYIIPSEYHGESLENKIQVTGISGGVEVTAEGSFSIKVGEALKEEDLVEEETEDLEETSEKSLLADIDLMALQPSYNADTDVLELIMESTNDHTKLVYAWMYQRDIYLAISHQQKIHKVFWGETELAIGSNVFIDSGNSENDVLTINGNQSYGKAKDYNPDKPNNKIWSVVKIVNQMLPSSFKLQVDLQGSGHSIASQNIFIKNSLLVYHQYGDESKVLDKEQSGSLDENFLYKVQPEYYYNNNQYELKKDKDIEVKHNGVDQGKKDLDEEGYLTGRVDPIMEGGQPNARAEITFYYQKIVDDDGELTIKKVLSPNRPEDNSREFDTFIYGPDERIYVVTLTPGKNQKTLTGLKYGEYTIKETVPMNFRQVSISSDKITLGEQNKKATVTITNERSNDSWFYDDNEKKNEFKVNAN